MTALMTYFFLCNLLEKRYVIFIISWHCSLGGNFLAETLRYLSWSALSRSWHLAASGMGLRVMSHQAGLLTTLHHIHICFPEQGGNMVTTMGGLNTMGSCSACMRRRIILSQVRVLVCRMFGTKPSPELMLTYCQLDPGWNSNHPFRKYKPLPLACCA